MNCSKISYSTMGLISPLVEAYYNQDSRLNSLYNYTPDENGVKESLRRRDFSTSKRKVLVEVLKDQYKSLKQSTLVKANIDRLLEEQTFTVTTGHQLNLFSGPSYFIYKILSTVALAERMNETAQGRHIVPVFWMASEDHDFEEANHTYIGQQKVSYNLYSGGKVGGVVIDKAEIEKALSQYKSLFKKKQVNIAQWVAVLEKAYAPGNTMAEAIRILVNDLFGDLGMVVIDGDDARLKAEFAPFMQRELLEQISEPAIEKANAVLTEHDFRKQVFVRPINLFYMPPNQRVRIERNENGTFSAGEFSFSEAELLAELQQHPEYFSPNALLRPLYQETVLPNVTYIGGGAEVAYWLQLSEVFKQAQVPMPVVLMRNHAIFMPLSAQRKYDALDVPFSDMQIPVLEWQEKRSVEQDDWTEFEKESSKIISGLEELENWASSFEQPFLNKSFASRKTVVEKNLEQLKRRVKAYKKNSRDVELGRFCDLQDAYCPMGKLQERIINFGEYICEYGPTLHREIKADFDVFDLRLYVYNLNI